MRQRVRPFKFFRPHFCLFTSRQDVIAFVYSSLYSTQTLDDLSSCFDSCEEEEKNLSIKRLKQENFYFRMLNRERKTGTETDDDDASRNDQQLRSWNCHCRSPSDALLFTISMWNSTIDNHSSVIEYHIEFTSFSFSCFFVFCRNSHVALFRLLFVADEAYETISSHLIF